MSNPRHTAAAASLRPAALSRPRVKLRLPLPQDKAPIVVTLPDGKTQDGTAFETTPFSVAMSISKGLAQACCIAAVRYSARIKSPLEEGMVAVATNPDGDDEGEGEWELWDLNRPLEGSCELKLHKFGDPEGQTVFWHSSAHILGEALELLYGGRLTHGPPTETGFFYDTYLGEMAVDQAKMAQLEKKAMAIAEQKQPFERVVVTKEECLAIFDSNPFKKAMISAKIPDGASTTVYRCAPLARRYRSDLLHATTPRVVLKSLNPLSRAFADVASSSTCARGLICPALETSKPSS